MEHAEQALPETFFVLGQDRYKLIPSFSLFVRFEKASGKNALDPLLWVNASATDLVTLVWAAIGGEKSGKSVDEVADLMNGQHLDEVRQLIRDMFKKAELPEKVKNDVAAE